MMMCLVVVFGVRYVGGGHGIYLGVLNAFVHVWMYGYYLLSAYYPSYKKNIWWKKYITMLQLVSDILLDLPNVDLIILASISPASRDLHSSCSGPRMYISKTYSLGFNSTEFPDGNLIQ